MVITYYGREFFKLQVGDTVIAFNPTSKESKAKTTKFGADIGLVTMHHPDFNGADQLSHGEKEAFIINGPGEYETKEIFNKGYATEATYEKTKKINTVYTVTFENINICFLGAMGGPAAMTGELKAQIGDVDLLFVPIGGGDVLDPADAYNKVAVTLEPHMIIPMHYEKTGKSDPLKTFLKEGGNGGGEVEKLTIKKKDLAGKEGEIIVIQPVV